MAIDELQTAFMAIDFSIVLIFTCCYRDGLAAKLVAFCSRPRFYLNIFGVVMGCLYAQILDQREVWDLLAREEYGSESKRFVEEALELMGYILIACGVVEERFFGESASNSRPPMSRHSAVEKPFSGKVRRRSWESWPIVWM